MNIYFSSFRYKSLSKWEFRKILKRPLISHSEKGAALISVLALSALIATVLPLILSDIQLEYAESRHNLNRLRATYNARSAVELSLLRILIYKEAQKSLKRSHSNIPEEAKQIMDSMTQSLLDMIWRAPIVWPLPIPEDLLESEKRELHQLTEESFAKGSYLAQIQPEDGKVDVNDLSSTVEPLRLFTYEVLSNLLLQQEEEEERKYTEKEAIQVLNNLADWTDADREGQTGGTEESPGEPPFPNRSFVSTDEVREVRGMTEALYTALKPHITVYGSKGLNVHYTNPSLLQALGLPLELMEEILARINPESEFYKPFQDVPDFCEWLKERGTDVCGPMETHFYTTKLLQFNTPLHFRIQATGWFKTSRVQVESLTYDANQAIVNYQTALEAEKKHLQPPPDNNDLPTADGANNDNDKDNKTSLPPPPPYKTSSSLLIMYWKEDL